MKTSRYIVALLLLPALFSCSKVVTYKTDLPDRFVNSGAPQISAVYDIYDGELEQPLEGGSLAQLIRITGKNLAHPTSVTFNGIAANLDECYCENENSYIPIPRVLPTEVSNKLVYTTSEGSTSVDFSVSIPQLSLKGLKNEFALPGTSVQVSGDFFDLFGFDKYKAGEDGATASITIGDTPVQIDSLTESYMSIVIPEGTPDNSIITFNWEDVTLGAQTKDIPYRQTDAMFLGDFSGIGFWSGDMRDALLTDGTRADDPAEYLGYPYFHFDTAIPAWTWYSCGMGGNFPFDIDWDSQMESLVFKCEIWTNNSFPIPAYSEAGILVQFNTKDNVSLDLGGGAVNTGGKWVTFSWPLSSVASEMPEQGAYWNFCLTVQPPVDWTVDFAMANFRIEPANY